MQRKFDKIYDDLKAKIEDGTYSYQELIPPESKLVKRYDCARNTVRRAIAKLAEEGYLVSVNGRGTVVIYEPDMRTSFALAGPEAYQGRAQRILSRYHTEVISLRTTQVDKELAHQTALPEGAEVTYIHRRRMVGERGFIVEKNYYLTEVIPGLTKEIAESSVYAYYQNDLGGKIAYTRRLLTVEPATDLDRELLELDGMDCVAVVNCYVFNTDGMMFEFSQARHKPKGFMFYDQSSENPISFEG